MKALMTYKPKMKRNINILSKSCKKYDTQNITYVSQSTYDILKYCDGTNNISNIGYNLSIDYQAYADLNKIQDVLKYANMKGWLE